MAVLLRDVSRNNYSRRTVPAIGDPTRKAGY